MFLSDHLNTKETDINANNLRQVDNCGYCGSQCFEKLIKYRENPDIFFLKCRNCNAITFSHILKQEAVDELYNSEAQYDHYNENSKDNRRAITFFDSKRFARHIARSTRIEKKENYRILDFGGGSGELACSVAEQINTKFGFSDCHIDVVDYTNNLFKPDNRHIHLHHSARIDEIENPGDYDIVIASAILEHLPEPQSDVRRLFDLLAVNGIMYCRTPSMYPLRRDLGRIGIEYDTLFPWHIWDLGEEWYKTLPEKVGFEGKLKIERSCPSIVEKTFKTHFFLALASYILKAPGYICHKWPYVGGWEVIYRKII